MAIVSPPDGPRLRARVDLPTPLRADQDGVGGILEEVERHQGIEGGPVDGGGPVPVEVAQRLEAADRAA